LRQRAVVASKTISLTAPIVGSYYIVSYEGSLFPGKAIAIGLQHANIICLQKESAPCGSTRKWPITGDIHDYPYEDIK